MYFNSCSFVLCFTGDILHVWGLAGSMHCVESKQLPRPSTSRTLEIIILSWTLKSYWNLQLKPQFKDSFRGSLPELLYCGSTASQWVGHSCLPLPQSLLTTGSRRFDFYNTSSLLRCTSFALVINETGLIWSKLGFYSQLGSSSIRSWLLFWDFSPPLFMLGTISDV